MSEPAPFPLTVSLPGFDTTATIHRFPDRPGLPAFMVSYPDYERRRCVKSFHDLETAREFAEHTLRNLAAEPTPVRVTKEGQVLADRVSGMLGGGPGPGGWIKGGGGW
jgi:hypothetical protein